MCSDDGLDEISIAATTKAVEYRNGCFSEFTIEPEQFGIARSSLDKIMVSNSDESLNMIKHTLSGQTGPAYDMLALNAGATIYAGDITNSIEDGVSLAREILNSGKALEKLAHLVEVSSSFS